MASFRKRRMGMRIGNERENKYNTKTISINQ